MITLINKCLTCGTECRNLNDCDGCGEGPIQIWATELQRFCTEIEARDFCLQNTNEQKKIENQRRAEEDLRKAEATKKAREARRLEKERRARERSKRWQALFSGLFSGIRRFSLFDSKLPAIVISLVMFYFAIRMLLFTVSCVGGVWHGLWGPATAGSHEQVIPTQQLVENVLKAAFNPSELEFRLAQEALSKRSREHSAAVVSRKAKALAQKHMRACLKAVGKQQWPEAQWAYQAACGEDPQNPAISIRYSLALAKAGKPDVARSLLPHVFELGPEDPNTWLRYGTLSSAMGLEQDAIGSFLTAYRCARDKDKRKIRGSFIQLAANTALPLAERQAYQKALGFPFVLAKKKPEFQNHSAS